MSAPARGPAATAPTAAPQPAADIRRTLIGAAVLVAIVILAPFVLYEGFVMKVLCFALFASAFNLLLGYVGLLSFGHAAFFGGAAYVSANALLNWGLTPELAVLAGTAYGAVSGALMGMIAIRRKGIYFSMITLALAQMIFFVALQWTDFTRGEDGVQGIPPGHLFGIIDLSNSMALYAFVAVVFLLGFAAIYRIVYSPFGQVLRAIKDNEPRAISLGYRVDSYKLTAFIVSAALSGTAGALKPLVTRSATLIDVQWQMSGEVILMTLLGGMGTILGPAVGATFVLFLENDLQGPVVPIMIGAIFIVCVLAFRRGIVGEIHARNLRAGIELAKIVLGVATAAIGSRFIDPALLSLSTTTPNNFRALAIWALLWGAGYLVGTAIHKAVQRSRRSRKVAAAAAE